MLEKNPDTLKIAYKAYPLPSHRMAATAAKAALAAHRQNRFWEFHDKLFVDYRNLDEPKISQIAMDIGLDMPRYLKDLNSREVNDQISRDLREAQSAEVTGTPTLFINGFRVKNRSLPAIQAMVDQELQKKSGKN